MEKIIGIRKGENFSDEIVIEKVVHIRSEYFNHFEKNLFESCDFIKKYKNLMFYDENSKSHEILVTSRSIDYGILVQSNGNDYPETCMIISKIGLF